MTEMNRDTLAPTLTFPTVGESFGTALNSATITGFGELVDPALFELSFFTRESFVPGERDGSMTLKNAEVAAKTCASATSAFRNGYAHHWIAALSEQVTDILAEDFVATVPRISRLLVDELADARRNGGDAQVSLFEWALALVAPDAEEVPLPPVTTEAHGGLLQAAGGAATILEIARFLDLSDADGCEGSLQCLCHHTETADAADA